MRNAPTRIGISAVLTIAALLQGCAPQVTGGTTTAEPTRVATAPANAPVATVPAAPTSAAAVPTSAGGTATTARVVTAANAFLATLTDSQRSQAVFDFSNTTAKAQWSNLPAGLFQWNGVRMGDLNQQQQQAVRDLLTATLSQQGYQRVMASVAADEALKNATPGNPLRFGADNYFVAVFGTPSPTQPWGYRFGGHHITVNASIAGSNMTLTPSFPGCQPCEFSENNQTVRADADQADRAAKLIQGLDDSQRQQAVRGTQSIDLVLGPNQAIRAVPAEGLRASTLNAEQQGLLLDLIGAYVNIVNEQSAALKLAEVRNSLADTYLAWYGPTTAGGVAYYRIQGPTLWIEFSPQGGGNAPGGTGLGGTATANHVHSIYRDPTNEYGAKWSGG